MTSAVPSYSYACIAPDRSGTSVYLVGVPVASEGRLEAYTVDLSNIDYPTATFLSNQTSAYYWSSAAPKACLPYAGSEDPANSPVMVMQFSPKSYFTNIYPNRTIDFPANFQSVGFLSPKLFSWTGAVGPLNWATTVANTSSPTTNSAWTGIRLNATSIVDSNRDFVISTYPVSNPLLSIGTYAAASDTPAQGYNVVFDNSGGGVIYTVVSSDSLLLTDRIVSLSSPQPVDMGGIKLTTNAITATMNSVGYILDKATDGSTVMYSISPGKSNKLQRVAVPGNVPTFFSNIVATAMGAKVIVYGSSVSGAPSFNSFDTVSGSWSGPGLVKPASYTPPDSSSGNGSGSDSSKTPIGAIIGGVVGGLVVLALVAFLYIRHRRKTTHAGPAAAVVPAHNGYEDPSKMHNPAAAPLMAQNYALQQQEQAMAQNKMQAYHMQPNPYTSQPPPPPPQQHLQLQPQPQDQYVSHSLNHIPVQYQSTPPVIFQPQTQEPYTYTPPTIIPSPPPQQPTFFQPQNLSPDQTYVQSGYIPPTNASSPHTPSTQAYTPTHSSTTAGNPQYIAPSTGDGYAA
ncbi:hypothetical protein BGZ70_008841 [Mortierella alpina]|uniref:Transmembrane protein n=1 Tax=Mortierella alpina TaxID=64518 RepID=A0A9P6JDQ8_MORAP|nr:hypothetical protein BGZ70_008841 [Mortierella alpina]